MKKLFVISIMVLFCSAVTLSFAEEGMEKMGGMEKTGDMGGPGMDKPMMGQGMMGKGEMGMGQGMMGKGMMGMMCPMMESLARPQIVSTGDGGFVILAGTKLTKYDKNLNVVKE